MIYNKAEFPPSSLRSERQCTFVIKASRGHQKPSSLILKWCHSWLGVIHIYTNGVANGSHLARCLWPPGQGLTGPRPQWLPFRRGKSITKSKSVAFEWHSVWGVDGHFHSLPFYSCKNICRLSQPWLATGLVSEQSCVLMLVGNIPRPQWG